MTAVNCAFSMALRHPVFWAVCPHDSCHFAAAGARETSPRFVANPSPTLSHGKQPRQLAEQPDDSEVAMPEGTASEDKSREDPGAKPTDAAIASAAATEPAASAPFAQQSTAIAATAAATSADAADTEARADGADNEVPMDGADNEALPDGARGGGVASGGMGASQAVASAPPLDKPTDDVSAKGTSRPGAGRGVTEGAGPVPSEAAGGGGDAAPPRDSHAQPSQLVRRDVQSNLVSGALYKRNVSMTGMSSCPAAGLACSAIPAGEKRRMYIPIAW